MPTSISDVLGIRVEKAFLVDLTTGESKDFLFNPAELDETAGVNWNLFESPGFSHKRPQAISGENMVWRMTTLFDQLYYELRKPRTRPEPSQATPGFEILPDDSPETGGGLPNEVEDWRNFMLSLLAFRRVRAGGLNRIAAASPTPVHFEWPGLVSTTIRVKRAHFRHTMFAAGTSSVRIYTVDLEVFEDPAERIYADDVRKSGTIRPWASSSPSGRQR